MNRREFVGTLLALLAVLLLPFRWLWDRWPWRNRYVGHYVAIIAGRGRGQVRVITEFRGPTLQTSAAWDREPDASSQYVIYPPVVADDDYKFGTFDGP